MSILQYPDTKNTPDLQIWNNVVFDDEDTEESASINVSSQSSLKPTSLNQSESLNLDSCKENKSPVLVLKSPVSIKPINSQGKPLKLLFKQGLLSPSLTSFQNENQPSCNNRKIDSEMEEIELEISRLSAKLEALRLEKTEQSLETTEKLENSQKENLVSNPTKINRRCVSLGPVEIYRSVRSRQSIKPEITPIRSRQKSCLNKLQEINERKVTNERRGRSMSPISRVSKNPNSKQGFTTIGSKKSVKKDESLISSIQPRKLFKEGERSVFSKKPIKNGRVVASRYNQIPAKFQKQSEQMNDESEKSHKKIDSLVGNSPGLVPEIGGKIETESRMKKRWEIPSSNVLVDSPSNSVMKKANLLPKIKIIRGKEDYISPRDSGAAKRVAELSSKKSYFGPESIELENSICQVLDFEEEGEE